MTVESNAHGAKALTPIAQRLSQLPGARQIEQVSRGLFNLHEYWRGFLFGRSFPAVRRAEVEESPARANPFEEYFDAHHEGPGIWKWRHYFSAYDRHLARFIGKEVHILEIGIFSGGSLGMWRESFGDRCFVYGVDNDPACKAYEKDGVRVFIGDQADRSFWADVLRQIPVLDVVIDDGGHQPRQQIATLEMLLPALRPYGVYVCEDVHGRMNGFQEYLHGLTENLNVSAGAEATPFQRAVHSVHSYPFLTVIERHGPGPVEFSDPRHGTEWLPKIASRDFEPETFRP